MSENYSANPGKNLVRAVDGVDYLRIPVKTHLITKDDDMVDVVNKYPRDKLRPGDILFISEKAVACTQNRAIPMEDIRPRKLAVTLSRYVTKTPAGIGLGIPETMEMALQECGTLRILFAAHGIRLPFTVIPPPGFLHHFLPGFHPLYLPFPFPFNGSGYGPERIQVLHLRPRPQLRHARFPHGKVHVNTHRPFLKLAVRSPQILQNHPQLFQIGNHFLCIAHIRFGYNFNQRHAGTVIIHQRTIPLP